MAARLLSVIGGPAVRTIVVGLVTVVLLSRRRWWQAALILVTVGGAGLANTLVKTTVRRRRPILSSAGGYSFPSGHSTGSLALLGAATYLVWRFTGEPLKALAVAAIGAPVTALIGLGRIVLHEHRPADVLGGYALATLWLVVSFKAFVELSKRLDPARR